MLSNTEIIHSIPVDELTGSLAVPIYQTSTFVQEAPGINKGYDYARTNNPTRAVLEKIVAGLEKGSTGVAFSSGLAAIDAVIKLLRSGDEIVAVDDIYGGAYRLFTTIYNKFGINVQYVDSADLQQVVDAVTPKTRLVWIESPTNPTLKISDIAAIAKIAKANGCLLCVDNTFASPALQNPLELGADIVIHSATKYLGGHSDLIAGVVVAKDPAVGAEIKYIQNASGAILAPFDSWLVIRGIETLSLRMARHCSSALKIAKALAEHPEVEKVFYPGLEDHPNHEVAKKQSTGFGGIISIVLKDDTEEAAKKFVTSTRLFQLAESLGGAKSLLCHPATMTHKSIPVDKRRAAGISDSLIRFSVGLEEAEDLLTDIKQALVQIRKTEFQTLQTAI